jgi:hypothetical protein
MVVDVSRIMLEVLHVSVFLHTQANDVKTVSNKWRLKVVTVIFYTTIILANPCAGNPCGNNGQCIQSNGGFYCECNLGYYGNQCDRKLQIYNISYSM